MLTWIPLLPLLGFLINGLWYALITAPRARAKLGYPGGHGHGGHAAAHDDHAHGDDHGHDGHHGNAAIVPGAIATLAIAGSFVCALFSFLDLLGMPAEHRVIETTWFTWIAVDALKVDFALRLDALSALFALVITGVGSLIHLYSIGYMGHDATPRKFFAYLNLFCFAMLMLVLGQSLPILFLGWEGVGLCSYLLIGYWYEDMEKAKAGKKAFVVNRVGDFGFLIGMFLIFSAYGTLEFTSLKAAVAAGGVEVATITAICLGLFVGCMGKSAQIPLYIWLPDAMAGPTPVSALIHAATMVTSGIYMVARLNYLYALSPDAMMVMACIGAFTAFFAATIAVAQTDIKKVLAYSTVSQLGYMFLGCGVGAFGAGVFHVITHAFFKALMFLGAGSVIHGMHHEQDITKMGGLRKHMPTTYLTFLVGWLAICGLPPLSGFFSKDEILWKAFSSTHGSPALWALGAGTAVLTAFYMTRLFSLTFLGKERFKPGKGGVDVHESPWQMTLPLAVLAILSAVGGFMGIPHLSWLEHWLEPVVPDAAHVREGLSHSLEWVLMGVSVLGAAAGLAIGLKLFADPEQAGHWKKRFPALHRALSNKWYVDELFEALLVRPILALSKALWRGFDVAVIDRTVLGFGRISNWTGQTLRVVQTGSMQVYALALVFGAIFTLGYLLYGLAR